MALKEINSLTACPSNPDIICPGLERAMELASESAGFMEDAFIPHAGDDDDRRVRKLMAAVILKYEKEGCTACPNILSVLDQEIRPAITPAIS